jgi:hypothetical protein
VSWRGQEDGGDDIIIPSSQRYNNTTIVPPYVAEEVMEHLKWGASVVFRKMCKGWRDAHDQSVTRLRVAGNSLPSSAIDGTIFPRVKELEVRFHPILLGVKTFCIVSNSFAITFVDENWLQTLAGLLAHHTSLDLTACVEVMDCAHHWPASLPSPASTWHIVIKCPMLDCSH